jgi:hypothetical protein
VYSLLTDRAEYTVKPLNFSKVRRRPSVKFDEYLAWRHEIYSFQTPRCHWSAPSKSVNLTNFKLSQNSEDLPKFIFVFAENMPKFDIDKKNVWGTVEFQLAVNRAEIVLWLNNKFQPNLVPRVFPKDHVIGPWNSIHC